MKKLFGGKMKLILPVLLLVLGAGGFMLKDQLPMLAPQTETPETESSQKVEEEKGFELGPIYDAGERIVNLADANGRHYLKITIALEFAADEEFYQLSAEEREKEEEEIKKELAPQAPIIQDAMIKILTSKTSEQISSVKGKEQLKTELRDQLNLLLVNSEVSNVYFTQFLIQ